MYREDPIAVSNDPFAGVAPAATRGVGDGPSWAMVVGAIGGFVLLPGGVQARTARRTLA